jgi:glycosyltransferase involved in cell wall biosynthesis
MSEMRVLHVINQFSGRAGAEVSLREVITETEGRGVRYGVAVLKQENNALDPLEAVGVPAYLPRTTLRSTRARVGHATEAIAAFRPDLVHTTLADANLAGRVAARRASVPVITTFVNTPYVAEARLDRDVARAKLAAVRLVDRVLCRYATTHFQAITQAAADAAVENLGVRRDRITVIPRGRSREHLGHPSPERRARTRGELGIPDEATVLICVGRQEPQKGHVHLINAMSAIVDRLPDAVLLMAGRQGARSDAIDEAVDRLGLRDRVRFLGVRRDVPDLLCAADVFVFPSLYEGLGGAVLEAMALEVPIVATSIPAFREVLAEGSCARLVPMADPAAISDAVLETLAEPMETERRRRAALERFEAHYRLEAVGEATLAMYRDVLGRAASGAGAHRG